MNWTEADARRAAAKVLGGGLDEMGCAPCPGAHMHTTPTRRKDFRVFFTGRAPAGTCVHSHCADFVDDFNKAFWKELFGRGREDRGDGAGSESKRYAKEYTVREAPKRFLYDIEALRRVQHPGIAVGRRWLLERSFSDVRYVSPGSFLGAVFDRGEKVLAFANERCQGEWGYVVGQGWVKLLDEWGPKGASGRRKEREPFPAAGSRVSGDGAGPREGRLGVWYLSQPVTGLWHWTEENRWSRRSWHAVTSWRHMVLESDDAPAELYLNWLVQQPLPVAAIYTSAGKSVHALLRFDGLRSKAAWDAVKDAVMPYFSKVGVDWKTLTAVRLTRLPGCLRRGKMVYEMDPETGKRMERYESYKEPRKQELLYLNARPEAVPIMDLPQVRSADEVPGPAGV